MVTPPSPIVVVGAGAAGLMAAIMAAEGPRPVLVLERTHDGGRKILISGGGRCNVLPSVLAPERFVTDSSPNTLRNLLRSWPLADQQRFFENEVGLPLALESETGKLFPASNRARDVRDGLVALARTRGVQFRFGVCVENLVAVGPGHWRVPIEAGEAIDAAAVVLATGGLSVPQTGSDGIGLSIVERLGHTIHATYPALTPLIAHPPVHASMAGVSLTVTIRIAGTRAMTRGGFLFTHRGYSGPAVLDLSHHATRPAAGERAAWLVQWTNVDEAGWDQRLRAGDGLVATRLRQEMPERLADMCLSESGLARDRRLAELRKDDRRRLGERLCRYRLPWTGDEGYRKAEVTGGGVALDEVDPRTLESRVQPGLFLCGEILDAFGPIGGHNFAWAWATGRLAGRGAAGQR